MTNSISSLLWISIVIPNFKRHNIIMSARVYFMKRVKECKDVSIMSPQDEQLFVDCNFLVLLRYNPMQSKHKQTKCEHSRRNSYLTDYSFLSRYHYTKSKNYLKRLYRIRHWIPCLLGHPVYSRNKKYISTSSKFDLWKVFIRTTNVHLLRPHKCVVRRIAFSFVW